MKIIEAYTRGNHFIECGAYIAYTPIAIQLGLVFDWRSGESIINNYDLLNSQSWKIATPYHELNLRKILQLSRFPGYYPNEKEEKKLVELILQSKVNISNQQETVAIYINELEEQIDELRNHICKLSNLEGEHTFEDLSEIDGILAHRILMEVNDDGDNRQRSNQRDLDER